MRRQSDGRRAADLRLRRLRALMSVWGESTGEAMHTSTFLGNPLACAAALAALDVLEEENLAGTSGD